MGVATATAATTASSANVALGHRVLRVGAHGPDVRELQKLLTRVGIKVHSDGSFGKGTQQAVKRFQMVAQLAPSGSADTKTVLALRTAASGGDAAQYSAGGYGQGTKTPKRLGDRIPITPGMSGHDVRILQDFLNRAGFKVAVDGEYGSDTVSAFVKFEAANALPGDENVDAPDMEVLRGQASAGPNAPSAPPPLALGPGQTATIGPDGLAVAPASAPDPVKAMIAAGNKIAKTPYIYGGGHGKWEDRGYDCSGSVSYVLHAAGLLVQPLVSGDFPAWGTPGPGLWMTIYGNPGHVYAVIAGLRFDTSGAKQDGTRWHADVRPTKGYGVSHPTGL